ncbi:MAG: DUF58 domain-containing protein [Myxococcota bacterium]
MAKKRDRRRSFRFTREGKVFVAVTVGVGLAAVNTGNNLLYLVLGLMLSLLLVSGTLSDVALWRVRVSRRLPRRAFVDGSSVVEVTLRNRKTRLPSYALEVEDRATSETKTERSCFFLKVSPGSSQTGSYRRSPAKRGWLHLRDFMVRTRYPFGLIEKGRRFSVEGQLLVYPKIVPVDPRSLRNLGLGTDAPSARLGQSGDVRGLREYLEGDEARSIHWLRSAARDELVVRERFSQARSRITLLLDQREPAHATEEDAEAWRAAFEEAVSQTASLADAALRSGAAVDVRVRGATSPLVLPGNAPDPIFRFLALLETVSGDEIPEPSAPGLTYAVAVAA